MIALSHTCMQTHVMVETLEDACTCLNDGQLHIIFWLFFLKTHKFGNCCLKSTFHFQKAYFPTPRGAKTVISSIGDR